MASGSAGAYAPMTVPPARLPGAGAADAPPALDFASCDHLCSKAFGGDQLTNYFTCRNLVCSALPFDAAGAHKAGDKHSGHKKKDSHKGHKDHKKHGKGH
eukprot:Hpha_TRINITY_DN28761_c0_g1::TRINITY_DN28761_c0_g1_i1::g.42459::m.42459